MFFPEMPRIALKWSSILRIRILTLSLLFFAIVAANSACSESATEEKEAMATTEYVEHWGPELGTQAPSLIVKDINGEARTREDLSGEKGLVIFFIRSTSW